MDAQWDNDGEPMNLEAAAEDALKWLEFAQDMIFLGPDSKTKLQDCQRALRRRLDDTYAATATTTTAPAGSFKPTKNHDDEIPF